MRQLNKQEIKLTTGGQWGEVAVGIAIVAIDLVVCASIVIGCEIVHSKVFNEVKYLRRVKRDYLALEQEQIRKYNKKL